MIAEELDRALRNEETWAEKGKCPREPDFERLYAVLGDSAKQDKIRERSEHKPCFILRRDPSACECLPNDIGAAHQGEPCPNNPYQREVELYAELTDQTPLLNIAHYIEDCIGMGSFNPHECTPEEWAVARIMHQRSKQQQMIGSVLGSKNAVNGD